MMERLLARYARLQERERRVLIIGAVVVGILLITAIVLPLERSVGAGAQRVERKRDDLAWLRSMAPQLADLGGSSAPPPMRESLMVVVDRTARQSSLAKALVGNDPSPGRVSVRFEQAPFDGLIAWLSQLRERYGVGVETATIDSTNSAGTVNATLVLRAR